MPRYFDPFTGNYVDRFSQTERGAIERKAIEQAIQAAELANATPDVFLPVANTWTATWTHPSEIIGEHCFDYARGLTDWDLRMLKINKISAL